MFIIRVSSCFCTYIVFLFFVFYSGNSVYVYDPLSYYVEVAPSRDYIYVCAPLSKENCLHRLNEAKQGSNVDNDSDSDNNNDNGSVNGEDSHKDDKKKQQNRSEIKLELKNGIKLRHDRISFIVNMHKHECYIYLNDQMLDVWFKNIPTSIVPIMSNCVKGNTASVSLSGIYV